MKSLFDVGFRGPFMAMPRSRVGLGQDDGFTWTYDQGPSSGDVPGLSTSIDNLPSSGESIPGLYTSIDQMPSSGGSIPGLYASLEQDTRPTTPLTNAVFEKDLQEMLKEPTPSTDWGKLAKGLVAAAGGTAQGYSQAQSKFNSARAKAGLPAMPLQTAAAAQSSSAINPNVIFLVGGLATVALLVTLFRA